MSSSGRRGWRPPANAQTFSFGPFLTCHCAHGVADDGEVAIDREEIRRGNSPGKGVGLGSKGSTASTRRLESKASQQSKLQLPDKALPELQAREARRSEQLQHDGSTASLAPSAQPSKPVLVPDRRSPSKVWTIMLSVWVCIGFVALAAGYPSAEDAYNSLEDRICKLQSAEFRSVSQDDGLDRYNLSPSMTCRVHLELYTGKPGCSPEDPGCWESAERSHGGWSKVTFQFPKEFLSTMSRETCDGLVQRYLAREHGFPCSVSEGGITAIAKGRQTLSPLRLALFRHPLAVMGWLVVMCLLILARLCGGPKTFCLASRMRRLFKFSGLAYLLLLAVAAATVSWRYSAAEDLISRLQEGRCTLGDASTTPMASDWPLAQALVCKANISVKGADAEFSSLAFASSFRWRSLESPASLECTDLIEQVYEQTSFACAFETEKAGSLVFAGRKDELSPLLVAGLLVSSMHPLIYAWWWWITLSALVLLVVATPATLLSCVRWRRDVSVEGYRPLPGR